MAQPAHQPEQMVVEAALAVEAAAVTEPTDQSD
jgi:hypothetical protein